MKVVRTGEDAPAVSEASANVTVVATEGGDAVAGEPGADPIEFVQMSDKFAYFDPIIRLLAITHSLLSLAILVAYYHLKVCLLHSAFACAFTLIINKSNWKSVQRSALSIYGLSTQRTPI